MARPPLDLGQHGSISTTPYVTSAEGKRVVAMGDAKPEWWRARTRVRDRDGKVRSVESWETTRTKATASLTRKLAQRRAPATATGEGMVPTMTVEQAAAFWLGQVSRPDRGLAETTREQYAGNVQRYITGSSIAGLRLPEVNRVPTLRTFLQAVADEHGPGAAKSARTVLSGILTLAVQDGAVEVNAVREVAAIRPRKGKGKATVRNTRRALTRGERDHLFAIADRYDREHTATADARGRSLGPRAYGPDVAALLRFMGGTGVRIGEALGLRWEHVNLDTGEVFIHGTKTASASRPLTLPAWLHESMAKRAEVGASGYVFPSPGLADREKRRDVSNTQKHTRAVFRLAGLEWATPHTLRRTAASLMDDAGVPLRTIADALGHADATTTMRAYLGRHSDTSAATAVL